MFYDADCAHCRLLARLAAVPLAVRGMGLSPLQGDDVAARVGVPRDRVLDELRMITRDGRSVGGAAALAEIATCLLAPLPVRRVFRIPGVMPAMNAAYGWVASRRRCSR